MSRLDALSGLAHARSPRSAIGAAIKARDVELQAFGRLATAKSIADGAIATYLLGPLL